jgi:hypothetical protein
MISLTALLAKRCDAQRHPMLTFANFRWLKLSRNGASSSSPPVVPAARARPLQFENSGNSSGYEICPGLLGRSDAASGGVFRIVYRVWL